MAALSPSSYVVLGLLFRWGPSSPYALNRAIAASIGYFWSFPRSQLYSESARLARLGFVLERRETGGRRRRVLEITEAGRAALDAWLRTSTGRPTEIHDEGLLRLFFSQPADGDEAVAAVRRLAAEQRRAHLDRLADYEELVRSGLMAADSVQRATLELGLRFERLAVDYWEQIAERPWPGGTE